MQSNFSNATLTADQSRLVNIVSCNNSQTNEEFIFILMNLAFNPDIDIKISTNAFLLLNKINPALIKISFDNMSIYGFFTELFKRKKLETFIPSRIASFILQFVHNYPSYSSECLGFFSKLLKFCNVKIMIKLYKIFFFLLISPNK